MTDECLSPAAFRRLLRRSVVAPLALLGVLALVFLGQILDLLSAAKWVAHTDQVIGDGNALLKLIVDGETGMRGYLLTNDPAFLEPYHAGEAGSTAAFDDLTQLVSDNPPQVERLKAVRAAHADWQEYVRRGITLRRDGGDYLSPVRAGEGRRRMAVMRAGIAEVIAIEEGLREERVRRVNRATWWVCGVSLGLAVLLGGALALLTRRQLIEVSTSYQTALAAAEARAESLWKHGRRLATLHQIDRAILAAESVPALTRAALLRANEVVPCEDSFVLASDPEGGPHRVITRADKSVAPASDESAEYPPEFAEGDAPQVTPDLEAVTGRSPFHERLYRAGVRSLLTVPLCTDEQGFGVLVFADTRPAAFAGEHSSVAHEIARQLAIAVQQARYRDQVRRHADELEQRVEERTRELQETLGNVKQLQGLLPICAWCKKVRDDQNYWHTVEHYIAAHTATRFTHGMCPDCFASHEAEAMRRLEQ